MRRFATPFGITTWMLLVAANAGGAVAQETAVPPALIAAVRNSPWDRTAVEAIAAHFDRFDRPRAELVRLQLARNLLDGYRDPKWNVLESQIKKLLMEHGGRWTAPVARIASKAEIEIGLIDSITVTTATDETIRALAPFIEIRKLRVESSQLTSAGYAALAAMPYLDELSILDGVLDQAAIDALEKLSPHADFWFDGDEETRKLVEAMNRKRVARYDRLSWEEKYAAGERFVRVYDFRPAFGRPARVADLVQAAMEDHQMRLLGRLENLEEIDITECDVTEKGLAQLAGLTKLKRLSLFETKVRSIASLERFVNLKELELTSDFDGTFGEAGVAVIENFKQLELLRLWDGDSVHDATVRRIGKLKKLKTLDLMVEIKDRSCLAALAGLPELEALTLHPSVDSASLEHLAGLTKLKHLNLFIDDGKSDAFRHLAGLAGLEEATFKGTAVTDEAIGFLAGCKELRVLIVQDTQVTREGAERLAAQLPNVMILTDRHVVKTPREKQVLRRRQYRPDVSLLVPVKWSDKSRHEGSLRFLEESWESIGGWSGPEVGPAALNIHVSSEFETAADAIRYYAENRSTLDDKTIERKDVVMPFAGAADSASCIYRDEHGKYLVCAARVPGGVLVFFGEVLGNRFEEFESTFLAAARSVRVGNDPRDHAEEQRELPERKK